MNTYYHALYKVKIYITIDHYIQDTKMSTRPKAVPKGYWQPRNIISYSGMLWHLYIGLYKS